MKKLLFSLLLIATLSVKAQYVPFIDTSFHPKIDTTLQGITACRIIPIKSAFSNDSATIISVLSTSDNLENIANLSFNFLSPNQVCIKSFQFTIQGQNYIDWTSSDYLFKLFATYIKNEYGIGICFK